MPLGLISLDFFFFFFKILSKFTFESQNLSLIIALDDIIVDTTSPNACLEASAVNQPQNIASTRKASNIL